MYSVPTLAHKCFKYGNTYFLACPGCTHTYPVSALTHKCFKYKHTYFPTRPGRTCTHSAVTSEWKNEVSHASWTHRRTPSIHFLTQVLICTPMHSPVILACNESNLIVVTSKWTDGLSHASWTHMRTLSIYLDPQVLICTLIHSRVILARMSQTCSLLLQNEQMRFPMRLGRTCTHPASIFAHKC